MKDRSPSASSHSTTMTPTSVYQNTSSTHYGDPVFPAEEAMLECRSVIEVKPL